MSSNVEKEPGPQADSPAEGENSDKKKREYKEFGHDQNEHTRKSNALFETSPVTYSPETQDAAVDMSKVRHF